MKTLLITSEPNLNPRALNLDITAVPGIEVAYYDDFIIEIHGGIARILNDKIDFQSFESIIFRNAVNNSTMCYLIGHAASEAGMTVSSRSMTRLDPTENKIAQFVLISETTLEVVSLPNTIYSQSVNEEIRDHVTETFQFPFVVKSNSSMKGVDNFLVNTAEELDQAILKIESDILFQQFIPNLGDFRLLFVGLNKEPLVFERRSDAETYLNNTSQGAVAIEVNDMDNSLIVEARRIAEILGYSITGIDLMHSSETDTWFFIEANATPALLDGVMMERKNQMLNDYVHSSI